MEGGGAQLPSVGQSLRTFVRQSVSEQPPAADEHKHKVHLYADIDLADGRRSGEAYAV